MFRLKKLYPPLGTKDAPVIEASYAEGTVEVVDGLCTVRLPETRDRLLKSGYTELAAEEPAGPPEKAKKRR
ncbi:MAG: hypothetical protein A2218_10330 [Elusimicrobia bacterium RIFOXYA2_FULL_53_38]|nr:MAG: hypothetical protein A2218_10330 [Elusimicrobia bacterium RIFOXYA2_FULL_53_38]